MWGKTSPSSMWAWLWPSKPAGEKKCLQEIKNRYFFVSRWTRLIQEEHQVVGSPRDTQTTELLVPSQDALSGTESLFLPVLHFYSSWDFPSHFFPLRDREERSCCLITWQSLSLFSSSFKLSLWFQQASLAKQWILSYCLNFINNHRALSLILLKAAEF